MNQESILKEFMYHYKKPTLKVASEITGIHATRVFRLLNGSEMKLTEYQVLTDAINKVTQSNEYNDFSKLMNRCFSELSRDGVQKLSEEIERKLFLSQIFNNTIGPIQNDQTA